VPQAGRAADLGPPAAEHRVGAATQQLEAEHGFGQRPGGRQQFDPGEVVGGEVDAAHSAIFLRY
jgi:hypothetical protein